MRQNLYTCCRCGLELRAPSNVEDAPLGWAMVTFERDVVVSGEDERGFSRQSVTTHACRDCGDTLLAFLEHGKRNLDAAFDDGGAS